MVARYELSRLLTHIFLILKFPLEKNFIIKYLESTLKIKLLPYILGRLFYSSISNFYGCRFGILLYRRFVKISIKLTNLFYLLIKIVLSANVMHTSKIITTISKYILNANRCYRLSFKYYINWNLKKIYCKNIKN